MTDNELKDVKMRPEPRTRTDKILNFVVDHKAWFATPAILIILGVLFRYIVIPVSIPAWLSELLIISTVGTLPSYIWSKRLYKRHFSLDVDVIHEIDMTQDNMVSTYYMKAGTFLEQYDVENTPLTWVNDQSRMCYVVQDIDADKKTCRGTWMGDIPDVELMAHKSRIEDQRIRNDKIKEFGSQVFMKWDEITETLEYELTNRFIRQCYSLTQPEEVMDVFDDDAPVLDDYGGGVDAEDILKEVGIETIKTNDADKGANSDIDG